MSRRKFPLLVLCVAASLLAAHVLYAQQRPRWAQSLPNLPDKPGEYQGLGFIASSGDVDADWQKASGKARSDIAQQIRVRIVNTVTRAVQETGTETGSNLADAYASTTEQMTEATLEEVPIERWLDDDARVLYAYGAITQLAVERHFKERLEGAVGSAQVYAAAAKKAMKEGNPYLASTQLLEGLKVVSLAEAYLNKPVMGQLDEATPRGPVLALLQSDFCATLSKIQVQIVSGDDQAGEKGRSFALPLVGRVVSSDGGRTTPIANTPVIASFVTPASGSVTSATRTNADGTFQFDVNEVTGGQAVNKIRASIALEGLAQLVSRMPDVARCWTHAFADFTFRLKTRTNVSIAMHIVETNIGKARVKSVVQEEIQKRLIGDRYVLVEESKVSSAMPLDKVTRAVAGGDFDPVVKSFAKIADVVVIGIVETRERNNPIPQIYFSTGTVTIRAIDVATGRILASVSVENEKEGGSNYEVAGTRLLQRLGRKIGEELKVEIEKALE